MVMQIAAIPTRYAGVNFRSRLEARWAAFFDIMGHSWEYEPIDLEGWTPDFVLKVCCPVWSARSCVSFDYASIDVYAEVKPVELYTGGDTPACFGKVEPFCDKLHVLLLGLRPTSLHTGVLLRGPSMGLHANSYLSISLADRCFYDQRDLLAAISGHSKWRESPLADPLYDRLRPLDSYWKEAGNRVQWKRNSAWGAHHDVYKYK